MEKHFVIYHSVAKRGELHQGDDGDEFAVLTDRPAGGAIGSTVWLISGQGSPAAFYLNYFFTADRVEPGDDEGFKHRVCGKTGRRFTPPVRIDGEPWFPAFLKSQGNFAFGLAEIREMAAARGLMEIASKAPVGEADVGEVAPLLSNDGIYPDEISPGTRYREGGATQVLVNAYERDPAARRACLAEFGPTCTVCEIDFTDWYGPLGEGFIHVHHTTPISEMGDRQIDPVRELVPVCPNCHAMLHRTDPPLTVEALSKIYQEHLGRAASLE